jgi:hypothetical protein
MRVLEQVADRVTDFDELLQSLVIGQSGILLVSRELMAFLQSARATMEKLLRRHHLFGPALLELWVQIAVDAKVQHVSVQLLVNVDAYLCLVIRSRPEVVCLLRSPRSHRLPKGAVKVRICCCQAAHGMVACPCKEHIGLANFLVMQNRSCKMTYGCSRNLTVR